MSNETKYHYFAATGLGWAVGKNVLDVLSRLAKRGDYRAETDNVVVYLVPGTCRARYTISDYKPQVEGTTLVGEFFSTENEYAVGEYEHFRKARADSVKLRAGC